MTPSKYWIFVLVLLCVWMLETGLLPHAAGQIVFSSNRDGQFNLYLMQEDGKIVSQLTPPPNSAAAPAWSPDGREIAFSGTNNALHVMNADGSNIPKRVAISVHSPVWSPEGDKIAGTSLHPIRWKKGVWTLVMVDLQSGKREKPNLDLLLGWAPRPSWSPDGQTMTVGGYTLDAENFAVISRPQRGVTESYHVWSPDGTRIAFHSNKKKDGKLDIYTMNSDGTNVTRLTNHPAVDGWPTWSPDGQSIAFVSNRDGNYEVYAIDIDGQNLRNLTNHPAEDRDPAWFPTPSAAVHRAGKLAISWGALKRSPQ